MTLEYAEDLFGAADITIRVTDPQGAYVEQVLHVTVHAVNDPPSFALGDDIEVAEDSSPFSQTGWVTNISRGPSNESSQEVEFFVSVDDPDLFSVLPSISSDGTLTFTLAPNAYGSPWHSMLQSPDSRQKSTDYNCLAVSL